LLYISTAWAAVVPAAAEMFAVADRLHEHVLGPPADAGFSVGRQVRGERDAPRPDHAVLVSLIETAQPGGSSVLR